MATRYISSWYNQASAPYSPFVNNPSTHTLASYGCSGQCGNQAANVIPPSTAGCTGCASCSPPPVMPSQYPFVEMSKPVEATCTTCGPIAYPAPATAPVKCDVCINSHEAKISKNMRVNLQAIALVLTLASAVGVGLGIADVVVSKLNFFKDSGVWTPCVSGSSALQTLKPSNTVAAIIFWIIVPTPIWASLYAFFIGYFAREACKLSGKGLDNLLNANALALGFFIPIQISMAVINLIMTSSCVNGRGSPEEGMKITIPVLVLIISIIQLILLAIVTSIVSKQRKCLKKARQNASTVYDPTTGTYACNCSSCLSAAGAMKAVPETTYGQYASYAPYYSRPAAGCSSCNAF